MKYRFRRRLLYTLLLVLDKLFLLIPYGIALDIGRFFGALGYIVLGKYRRLSKTHLRLAFGGLKTEKEISKITKSVFINLGMGFAEILSLPKIRKKLEGIVEVKGIERMEGLFKEGKGVMAISAHIGNWEFLPMYFAYKGYPVNVVARPIYYEKYDEWVSFLRSSMGVNVIYRTESPRKLLQLLKKNELIGILPDQDIDSIEGVFVDFFKMRAYTASAPVRLAMAAGVPILPIFIIRNKKRHTIFVEEPIIVEEGHDKEAAVLFYTQKWSEVVESYVRKYPQQWVWMHRRWKTHAAPGGKTGKA